MLDNDLFILGKIILQDDGLLKFSDFDRIYRIVLKHASIKLEDQIAEQAK